MQLAKTVGELINLALSDLKICESKKDFEIDFNEWACIDEEGVCIVCLAGSVITQTLGFDPTEYHDLVVPKDTDYENELEALNFLSRGLTDRAFEVLGLGFEERQRVTFYEESTQKFYEDMSKLACKYKDKKYKIGKK